MKYVGEDGWGRGGKIRDWYYWEYAYTPILYLRTMESAIQRRLSLPQNTDEENKKRLSLVTPR